MRKPLLYHRGLRPLALLCAMVLLVAPLRATWSIVIVDRLTGEVCVATATCIPNANIQQHVPVIVVDAERRRPSPSSTTRAPTASSSETLSWQASPRMRS